MKPERRTILGALALTAIGLTVALTSGCGGSGSTTYAPSTSTPAITTPATTTTPATGADQVLPVATNPISNTSTSAGLTITKALVENNVSPDTGKAVDDHLEIALENTTTRPLDQLEVYTTITDKTTGVTEGYFSKLTGLTIPPGTTRVVHFDNSADPDHYPVNKYSLYYTDKNALVVNITASSPTVKIATFTVKKDAGGAEAGVE